MRRERLIVVVALVALGGATVLASTQPFARITVTGVKSALVVAGSQVVPALAPLGIVLLALALALSIAGRVARTALGAVTVLLGAGIVALALPSVLDASAGTRGAVRAATGVTVTAHGVLHATGTAWPTVGVVAGALAMLLGLSVLVRGRRWPVGGARYRSGERPVTTDPIDEWDALTRGSDPTG